MTKPTNEERREVAARLRVLSSHREVDKELVEDALGLYMGECIDGYDPVSVMELADLIEPEPERTCRKLPPLNSGDRYTLTAKYASGFEYSETLAYARCSECGTHFCADFAYCPECGAKEAGR